MDGMSCAQLKGRLFCDEIDPDPILDHLISSYKAGEWNLSVFAQTPYKRGTVERKVYAYQRLTLGIFTERNCIQVWKLIIEEDIDFGFLISKVADSCSDEMIYQVLITDSYLLCSVLDVASDERFMHIENVVTSMSERSCTYWIVCVTYLVSRDKLAVIRRVIKRLFATFGTDVGPRDDNYESGISILFQEEV